MQDIWKDVLDENGKAEDPNQLALVRRTVSSPNEVVAALDTLIRSSDVSTRVLEKLLEIERHPTLIKLMRSPGTIPACMALVRRRHRTGELFTSRYGYLVLRCLLLSLEVSILMHCSRYAMTSEQGHWTPSLRADVARGVRTQISVSVDLEAPFLRWESSGDGEQVVFPFAGGLTVADAVFLIDAFWKDRKALLGICLETGLSGLSNLLVIFWQFSFSHRSYWEKIDVLQRRNYAVAPAVDLPITSALFKPFSINLNQAGPMSYCVDGEDSVNLLAAFRRNVGVLAADDSVDMIVWLMGSVKDDTQGKQYLSSLININRELAVSLVERFNYGRSERIYTLQIGALLISCISAFFQGLNRNRWLTPNTVEKTMEGSQAIGISGQAYLLMLSSKLAEANGKLPRAITSTDNHRKEVASFDSLLERIQLAAAFVKTIKMDPNSEFSTLSQAHLDWSRIMIHFDTLFSIFTADPNSINRYAEPWATLGRVLRFKLDSKHLLLYLFVMRVMLRTTAPDLVNMREWCIVFLNRWMI
ncbi:hypothetical protein RhiJN_09762 [Ceratobasidium sp. AG-Ba]|nr:hypothetical protein RhiJN_09762 [Ceratobasidium sp. AG-Ba]